MHIKREVKLAVTAIAAVIILIWGINFLKAKALFERNNVFYGVYDQVDGLKISSSVIYRGYSVGQVSSIRFFGERFDRVLVQFTVGKKLQIPANTTAVIQNADLMGSKAINLLPGDSFQHAVSGDTLQTEVQLGIMEQLNKQIEPLKQKAESIMVSLDTVLLSIQEIFNTNANGNIKESLQSVGRTLNNVEQISTNLNGLVNKESARISEILAHINSLSANLESNNAHISNSLENVEAITDSLREVNLAETIRRANSILWQLDSIAAKINHGKGSLGGVINDGELYYNLTTISENLNKLLVEFRANPKRFVNLSVFDFSSNKRSEDNYGIVVAESEEPLPANAELYLKNPDIKEIRRGGKFLYLLRTYKNLKQAEKDMANLKKDFNLSYIIKTSQN